MQAVVGLDRAEFRWAHRPDAHRVAHILIDAHLPWTREQVFLKMMPLFLEWDMRQGPTANPRATVFFKAVKIVKVSGLSSSAAKNLSKRGQI